jgi:hypothetical protein
MKARGYDGYHAVFLYEFDEEHNREKVKCVWLRKETSWADFRNLFASLEQVEGYRKISPGNDNLKLKESNYNDIDLMNMSGAVTQQELGVIFDFFEKHRMPNVAPSFENHVNTVGVNYLNSNINPLVIQGVNRLQELISQKPNSYFDQIDLNLLEILEEIHQEIISLQFSLYVELENISGISQITNSGISMSSNEFLNLTRKDRLSIMEATNFVALYCGGRDKVVMKLNEALQVQLSGYGNAGSLNFIGNNSKLKICRSCGYATSTGDCQIGFSCCEPHFNMLEQQQI